MPDSTRSIAALKIAQRTQSAGRSVESRQAPRDAAHRRRYFTHTPTAHVLLSAPLSRIQAKRQRWMAAAQADAGRPRYRQVDGRGSE